MKKHISFDTPDAKAFLKAFRSLTDRHEAWQVWSDFITLEACSIAMNCEQMDKARVDQRMKWASATAERYDGSELDQIAELAAITSGAFQKNPRQDFLGQLYMSLDFGDTWRGQFFTPWNCLHDGDDDSGTGGRHHSPTRLCECIGPLLRCRMYADRFCGSLSCAIQRAQLSGRPAVCRPGFGSGGGTHVLYPVIDPGLRRLCGHRQFAHEPVWRNGSVSDHR